MEQNGVLDGKTICFLGSQKNEEQGIWNRLGKDGGIKVD